MTENYIKLIKTWLTFKIETKLSNLIYQFIFKDILIRFGLKQ